MHSFEKLETRRLLSGAGILDTTFGTGGSVTEDFGSFAQGGPSTVQTLDDKIIMVGTVGNPGDDLAIARYMPDGTLDTTFDGDGKKIIDVGSFDLPTGVAVRSDGKIVISGTGTFSDADPYIITLNSDGSLDTDFGGGIIIMSQAGDQNSVGVVLDSSNNAYMLGYGDDVTYLYRFTTTGIDTDFGVSGTVTLDLSPTTGDLPRAIARQPADGKLLIGGDIAGVFNGIARVDADGNLDTDFGTGGIAVTSPNGTDVITGLTVDGSGNIVACGWYGSGDFNLEVQRYTSSGDLDTTFASGAGWNEIPSDAPGNNWLASSLKLDSSGNIIVGVQVFGATSTIGVGRFTASGDLDTDFGDSAGHTLTPLTGFDGAGNVSLQSDGRIILGGSTANTTVVLRYSADTVSQPPPVADAGPDQIVNEGQLVSFDGSDSTGTGLTYAWDLDGDGFFDDGFDAVVSWTYYDNGPVTVTLQVTDSINQTSTDTLLVTVNNVDPSVDPVSGPASPLVRQQTASFTGSFSDDGTLDTFLVSWDFGDGNVIAYHPSTDAGALTPTHTYTTSGSFTVTLYVKDDDNGVGSNTTGVTVVSAALQGGNLVVGGTEAGETINLATTSTPGQVKVSFNGVEFGRFIPTGQIIVNAGGGADKVTVAAGVAATQVNGGAGNDTLSGGNGADTLDGGADDDNLDGNNGNDSLVGGLGNDTIIGGNDNDISRGGDGNDSIVNNGGDDLLDGGIGNDTLVCGGGADTASGGDGNDSINGGNGNDSLFGGNDDDHITGGAGLDTIDGGAGNDDLDGQGDADIVVGGSGADSISGGADRDILIGGTGTDSVIGNADEDILIAGTTDHDGNVAGLTAIQAEWTSGHTYAQRLANLRNGSGGGALNGSFFLDPDATVHDDGAVDTLTGSGGIDWFLFNNDLGVHDVITDLKPAETASDID